MLRSLQFHSVDGLRRPFPESHSPGAPGFRRDWLDSTYNSLPMWTRASFQEGEGQEFGHTSQAQSAPPAPAWAPTCWEGD